MHYVKILNKSMKHNNFIYKEGLNVDHVPFDPTGECKAGGLYFCEVNDVHLYLNYGTLIADVEIPSNAQVYREANKLKSDRIVITNIIPIRDHIIWTDPDFCNTIVNQCGGALKYAKKQTDEICKIAVVGNGYALEHVNDQTDEICRIAVAQNGMVLMFVKEQTDEICKIAVNQNGLALEYVEVQTEEICKIAVKENGLAIEYVEVQTEEICLTAVKQSILALYYMEGPIKNCQHIVQWLQRNWTDEIEYWLNYTKD
jgi:hypothetical protein